ncbi:MULTISPECIES: hypothetical protein [Xenorhabdus]|uniref:hypothetical protein n=1 Tax=Xenorhabdus TaxID=626 RepID=UPI00064A7AC2|nr:MULTISPECIES: hypothetical protein [Xenorhabdus]KLU14190.1 hypothetical protein AAY47_17805 [Xenorhabdus griffiniae]KOP35200.1 hypothetical protein AFK69_00430 [Xenorhabdus sp. GDc328]
MMKLLSPLNYLKIKHEEKKWYDLYLPLAGAIFITIVYSYLPNQFKLIGNNGLISQVNGLLQVLIGFYIAALAAVSTFGNARIDDIMAGTPPTLKESFRGKMSSVKLTRRRFICYLFGYLALVSFALFSIGLTTSLVGQNFAVWFASASSLWCLTALKIIFVFVYFLMLLNIATTTLLGLYFLAVRIHQSDI